MTKHIFAIGLDPFRLAYLNTVRHAERYKFHGLLDFEEVIMPLDYPFEAMLKKAERQIREFPDEIAGIITHWDFPGSTMLPILCQEFGFRSASPEAVMKCEHKYWSRLEQQAVLPDWTPAFCAVDPFAKDPLAQVTIDFPFWIKPIKSFSSHLGFRIGNKDDFQRAIPIIRNNISRIGDAFNVALSHVNVAPEVGPVDGNWCIAEEITQGKQCGIEGYMADGHFGVHGFVDTVKDSKNHSFTRYEYPSVWPEHAQRRIYEAGETLMRHIGFDNSPFGIEFFWDEERDRFSILEVNTRISQSHSDQFVKVRGASNHDVAVDVALGREPTLSQQQGPYHTAAKFMLRRYHDAVVERIPTTEEIQAIEHSVADSKIVITVDEGQRLSDLRDQDSYSYEIAHLWLGAQSQQELLDTYRQMASRLHFEFSDGQGPESFQFEKVRY